MYDRPNYKDFKTDFLFQLAVIAKADPDSTIEIAEVASTIDGSFPGGWAKMAASDLESEGRLVLHKTLASTYASLTGFGLETAEEHGGSIAYELWQAIDDFHEVQEEQLQPVNPPAQGAIVTIDPMSDVFQAIEADIRETIRVVRAQNELMSDAEAIRMITELEAGQRLINAPQADSSLIKRLLLPALVWFGKRAGDEATKALIKRLLDEVVKWLATIS